MRYLLLLPFLCLSFAAFSQEGSIQTSKVDSGYYTSFDKTKIYYEVRGVGQPVVLIHGFIVNGNAWQRTALLNDLLANGFRVITLDLRGNGKSDKPKAETAYANDAEAKDIMGLANYLHLKSYDAVGYSRGSIITARLLMLDRRVRRAVLGGMGTGFTNPQWPRRIMFYEALMGKPVKELEGAIAYVKTQGLDTLVLAYLQKYQPSTSPSELATVKQPVLIISGDQDSDNGSAAELAAMFRNRTVATVPGDHNHAAGTKEFAENVISFLRKE